MTKYIELSVNKQKIISILNDDVLNKLGDELESKIIKEQIALLINKTQPTNCPTCRIKNNDDTIDVFDVNCLLKHYCTKEHMENSSVRL